MKTCKKCVRLSRGLFDVCFIGIGMPTKYAKMVEQKEINLKERIHSNRW